MEYVYYVVVVLVLLAICFYVVRRPGESGRIEEQARLAERARRRSKAAAAEEARAMANRRQQILGRELRKVPTPWGWPGSEVRFGNGQNGTGGSQLQQWIDRLVSEKRTVDDNDYLLRRDASLRAMLEDRFGRANRPTEMAYQPVRAPLLRDPNRPYDQMDNFPSGQTDRIVAKLQRQPRTADPVRKSAPARANVPLRDIKTPWGW